MFTCRMKWQLKYFNPKQCYKLLVYNKKFMYVHIQYTHMYLIMHVHICIYFTYIRIAVHILLFSAHLTQFHKFSLGTHVEWMLVSTLSIHCNCTFFKLCENFMLCFSLICRFLILMRCFFFQYS